MKQLLFFILLFIFALPATASANEIDDLNIKGVSLGTKESIVLRKFGKPLKAKRDVNDCGGAFRKTFSYSGLVIELERTNKMRNFEVVRVEVTSSKWPIAAGIGIGADVKDVLSKFGQIEESLEEESGRKFLSYRFKRSDAYATFYFRNNKLVEVKWFMDLC